MTRPRLVVRPKADEDVEEQARHYAREASLNIALRFYAAVDGAYDTLREHPEIGRWCRFKIPQAASTLVWQAREPFDAHLIFYRAQPGEIEIIRVLHAAQDLKTIFEED